MPYGTLAADVISTSVAGSNIGPGNATRFKNKIINGDMRIDQRNAGASVTLANASETYALDRWRFYENTDGVITIQQSSVAPTGFVNSMLISVTTADTSIGATQLAIFEQRIEGLNVGDLGWGTANAKSVTLSFWVRSSVTGQFGGSVRNSADNRSYAFSYTINAANTWELETITIPGDTTGTWLTTNGIGLQATFGLAVGSNFLGSANTWTASNLQSSTGQTNLLATVGNTFYITGVQLEVGTSATGFEYVDYGTQLNMCQRYFFRGSISYSGVVGGGSGTVPLGGYQYPQTMRTAPTTTWNSGGTIDNGSSGFSITSLAAAASATVNGLYLAFNIGSNATIGRGCALYNADTSFSAEL